MIERQRIVTYGISTTAAATIALALWLQPWKTGSLVPQKPGLDMTPVSAVPSMTQPDQANAHRVDIVFAVDTTASMGGLLDGAKRTVWSIASHVKEIDPQADLHVGLVAYRDTTPDSYYVTKDFPLTSDLDAMFTELASYRAQGGGDVPEDVDAAMFDAVHKMQWRSGATKLIFLVGDAPPASRGDVQNYDVSAREAADLGITINSIRCGDDQSYSPQTADAWQKVATLGHGEFSTIKQDGGVHQMPTPYDDKLAKLSDAIDQTAVIYGDSGAHLGYEGKMAATAAAPAASKADRASYYAKKGMGKRAAEDLVGGSVNLDGLEDAKLPEGMRGMSKDKLKGELDRRAEQRAQAQTEMAKVAKEHDEYLKSHAAAGSGADAFDNAVKTTVDHELK